MSRFTKLSTCSALALGVAAGPAFADLTAQDVWDGMESAMTGFGYTVTATETPTSDGLDVTDVMLTFDVPDENSKVSFGVSSIDLVNNGDGSVTMTFPASMPIMIDAAPEGEDDVSMVLEYNNSGLEIVVSGDPSALNYAYTADSLSMSLAELIVNDEVVGRDEARFDFALTGMTGTAQTAFGNGTRIEQEVRAESARYEMAFNDPESTDTALISGSMQGLSIDSATTLPEGFDASAPESLLTGDFLARGKFDYTDGEMQFAGTAPEGTSSGTTRSGAVSLEFSMDGSLIAYNLSATDQAVTVTGTELPVPVSVNVAESAFNVTMPIAASDTPEDMALGMTFGGFEMSDVLWNMVDPAAALPRDPVTIALDLTGKVTPFVSLFDPVAMAQLEATGGMPGELNALTLNDLTIEAAGAKLGGTGAFTFDNTDLQTFGGFPRPSGGVDFSLEGANSLIDKLIGMGLITNEDAMGARMMMSMFAVPGTGPDSLKSSIQINDQGHVLANGMRIQ
ncbi:DUF2125 domain-containing protein [Marivita sp. S6314]|uniref:DUF2125 domain-containing protein n=1 Tax=Marivita sp. S6314 TaxID=2926406 RepID=UPI001FF30042|nr:DUF2125 domain-containing protein [Marivita sp. S6314]MCK0149941.1 DUF2125 domain-containing protein [Marivita sp. S6314]